MQTNSTAKNIGDCIELMQDFKHNGKLFKQKTKFTILNRDYNNYELISSNREIIMIKINQMSLFKKTTKIR